MIWIPSILITAYWIFEGIREGYYWSALYRTGLTQRNIHDIFLYQRTLMFILVTLYVSIPDAVYMAFAAPLIHNGTYYQTRKILDKIYPEGFWSQSNTSTAKSSWLLTPLVRIILFSIGFSILTFYKLN